MKKRYVKVRKGVRQLQLWDENKQRWKEAKSGKFEVSKTISVDGASKRVWQTFDTAREVNAFLENTVAKRIDHLQRGMLFRELVTDWKKAAGSHLFVSSRDMFYCKLKYAEAFFNEWEVEAINANAIDLFLAHMKTPEFLETQKSTRLSYKEELQALRMPLTYYVSRLKPAGSSYALPFLREHRKMAKVRDRAPSPKKDMHVETVAAFLLAMREDLEGKGELEGIFYLASLQYSEAARVQEIAALDIEDIDLETGTIMRNKRLVWLRHETKNSFIQPGLKARDSLESFSAHSRALIKEWLMKSGRRSGLLFSVKGRPLSYRMIQFRYDRAFEKIGSPLRGTHILRHAALSEHYALGGDLQATREKAGHASVSMTERYAKSRTQAQNRIQQLMDERLNATMPTGKVGTGGNSVDFEVIKEAN